MPELLSNLSGTTSNSYRIGKRGVRLFQGDESPSEQLGANGDVYFEKDTYPKIWRKEDSEWKEIGTKKINVVSSNQTITLDKPEEYFLVDSSSSNITVTLSSTSVKEGYSITIKDYKGNSEINNITINTENSEKIDDNNNVIIADNYASLTFLSDGINWYII